MKTSEPASHAFPPQARLRHRAEFQRVYRHKCSAADSTLIVYAVPNGLDRARLGLSVSRKVGNAVCRNRWKRRIREAFRTQVASLPTGFDFVVIPRRGAVPQWSSIQQAVDALFPRVAKTAARRTERS